MTEDEIREKIRKILQDIVHDDSDDISVLISKLDEVDFVNFQIQLRDQFGILIEDTAEEQEEIFDNVVKFVFNRLPKPEPADAAKEEPIVNESLVAFSGNAPRSFAPGRSNQAGAAGQPTVAAEADSESTGGTTLKEFLQKHNLDQFLGVYTFHHNFLVLRLESSGKGLFATWISKEAHLIGELFGLESIQEPTGKLPDKITIASGELIGDGDTAVTYTMVAKFTKTGGAQLDILPPSGTSKHSRVELSAEEPSAAEPSVCQGNLFVSSKTKDPITLKMRHFE